MGKKVSFKTLKTSKESAQEISVYNVRQKRCWALIVHDLQQFISPSQCIDWDNIDVQELARIIPLKPLTYEYEVEIFPEKIISMSEKRSILPTLKKLTETWIHTKEPLEGEENFFVLFNNYKKTKEGRYFVSLPLRSIRWMLNFGQKNIYTSFHLPSYLKLSSSYSMNLYMYLSDNLKKPHDGFKPGEWECSLEDFRKIMNCPDTYDAQAVKNKILSPSKAEFGSKKTRLDFDFEMLFEHKVSGKGRRKIDRIFFRVIDNER